MRRMLEWLIFLCYWLGFGSFAIGVIYWRWLVQELEVQEKYGRWQSLAVFLVILLVLYFIVRRLVLMLYAKCKVSEKRLIHNMKKEVREMKQEGQNANYQANIAFENEKLTRKSKRNKGRLTRGRSLDDLTRHDSGKKAMKNSRSLETILNSQRYRVSRTGTESNNSSVLFYEELPVRYGTPPPAYHTLGKQYYDTDDEYEVFRKLPPMKPSKKRGRSAEYVLDIDETYYNLPASRSHSCDELDGMPRKLRKAPAVPPPPPLSKAKRSKSLTKISNKPKSFDKDDLCYEEAYYTHRAQAPLPQHLVEVHQPQQYYYTQPRSHSRSTRPDMVKQVLVANTLNQKK